MNYQGPGTWTRWIPDTFLGNRHHICVSFKGLKLVGYPNIGCGASTCLTSLSVCQKAFGRFKIDDYLKTLFENPSEEKGKKFSCTKIFESYRKHR